MTWSVKRQTMVHFVCVSRSKLDVFADSLTVFVFYSSSIKRYMNTCFVFQQLNDSSIGWLFSTNKWKWIYEEKWCSI